MSTADRLKMMLLGPKKFSGKEKGRKAHAAEEAGEPKMSRKAALAEEMLEDPKGNPIRFKSKSGKR
jgi:hypothetical protein